jgi:hypothetical protein
MFRRLALTPLLLFLVASCDNWSDTQVVETKRRGDIVCRAIEAYRTRNGKVPSELKELQPEFLREIPQPTVGKKSWTYATYQSGHSYNLEVAIERYSEPLLQTQSEGGWSYDTK